MSVSPERFAEERPLVCAPITAFPVAGGMRGVLAEAQRVLADDWRMQFLTRHRGPGAEKYEIESFGKIVPSPWHTPGAWLYALAGWLRLRALLKRGKYRVILPQDGVFTGAFAAVAGRHAGVRVVVMDHGNVTWLNNIPLQAERRAYIETLPLPRRVFEYAQLVGYWPTLRALARITARNADAFLVAGDEVEEVYRRELGVEPSRIIRYPYVVDARRFTPATATDRAALRAEAGLPEDALVITMINRLEPEKGLDVALAGIRDALAGLPSGARDGVRVVIAGDGTMRGQVERDIARYGMEDICTLWGEATPEDVKRLLRLSDVFLYAGTRGTNYSIAVLEAMASGCAVIGTTQPRSNVTLLAEGRGIAVPAGDAAAITEALGELLASEGRCREMGARAREYVVARHSDAELRRCLLRAAFPEASARESERDDETKITALAGARRDGQV